MMTARVADKQIESMIGIISEIQGDSAVPKNVREKLQVCASALQENVEMSLRVDKVRHALEEISDDTNLQSYTRTQIWSISSMLERL